MKFVPSSSKSGYRMPLQESNSHPQNAVLVSNVNPVLGDVDASGASVDADVFTAPRALSLLV